MFRRFRNYPQIGGKKGGLPYDAEVDYIENASTAYIFTGLNTTTTPVPDFDAKVTFTGSNADSNSAIFGWSYGGSARYGIWKASYAQTIRAGFIGSVFADSGLGYSDEIIEVSARNGKSITINGVTTAIGTGANRAKYNIWIFANSSTNDGKAIGPHTRGRVYYLKFYDVDGNLIRDFIPVRKGAEGGLYDRVEGKCYWNEASDGSAFVVGPDKRDPIADLIRQLPTGWKLMQGIHLVGGVASQIVTDVFADVKSVDCEINNSGNARFLYTSYRGNSYVIAILNNMYYLAGGYTASGLSASGDIAIDLMVNGSEAELVVNGVGVSRNIDIAHKACKLCIGTNNYSNTQNCVIKCLNAEDTSGDTCKLVPVSDGENAAVWDMVSKKLLTPTDGEAFVPWGNEIKSLDDCTETQKRLWFGLT